MLVDPWLSFAQACSGVSSGSKVSGLESAPIPTPVSGFGMSFLASSVSSGRGSLFAAVMSFLLGSSGGGGLQGLAAATAKFFSLPDIAVLLGRLLLARPGVAGRQLDVPLRRDARLQLATAFHLGVELRAEEQREVRDPQPQQKDDHSGQRAVGLVVVGELRNIETEYRRCDDPAQNGDHGTDADPA